MKLSAHIHLRYKVVHISFKHRLVPHGEVTSSYMEVGADMGLEWPHFQA